MEEIKEIRTRNEIGRLYWQFQEKNCHIYYMIKKIENLYESFKIPKKNGGFRQIHAPKKDLKQIQKSLAEALYKYEKEIAKKNGLNSNISHAFEKGKSFITNAQIHRNWSYVKI